MPLEEQTYRVYVKEKLEAIDNKVTYTNGKVRKIIIAMTLLAGIVLGQVATSPASLIAVFTHFF